MQLRVAFAQLARNLGECLCVRDSYAHRDSCVASDDARELAGKLLKLFYGVSFEVEKGLVYGVYFYVGNVAFECLHHSLGHVSVETVVARVYSNVVTFHKVVYLVQRLPHLYAYGLCFVAARDYAAVVVAEHNYGTSVERGVEHTLTRYKKVVAVA